MTGGVKIFTKGGVTKNRANIVVFMCDKWGRDSQKKFIKRTDLSLIENS